MSENVRTGRKAESETRPPAAAHPKDAETAGGVRVDRAHPPIGDSAADQADSRSAPPVEQISAVRSATASPPDEPAFTDDDLIEQAGRIAGHLKSRLSEIGRREQSLSSQLHQLDSEQRSFRMAQQQFKEDTAERYAKLKKRENDIAQKVATLEKLTAGLEAREQSQQAAEKKLAAKRGRLCDELQSELESDRKQLQDAQAAAEAAQRLLSEDIEQHRREHEAASADSRKQLDAERAVLQEEFEQKLAIDRSELHRTQEAVDAQRDELCEQIERNRREHEDALAEHQRRGETEQKAIRKKLTVELKQERDELSREKEAWFSRHASELAEIERERDVNEVAFSRAQDEITALRAQQADELEKLKQNQQRQLLEDRHTFEKECEWLQAELQQERSIFENRVRFQMEHLDKSRGELETFQNESRREQQQTRLRFEQSELLIRLRTKQVEHARLLLEERELSVEREAELLRDSRETWESEFRRDKQQLVKDRDAWDQEQPTQRAELRRQQDMLTLHTKNLEGRRTRLDSLRAELEETHRSTLEMRMALEEAWSEFSKTAGTDAAKQSVDKSRDALAEHYRHVREALTQQRKEVDEAQELFQRQKDEYREEQQKQDARIGGHNERLRVSELELRTEAVAIEDRETAWRETRDRWVHEKIEAEEIIRGLLRQLADLNRAGQQPENAAAEPDPGAPAIAPAPETDRPGSEDIDGPDAGDVQEFVDPRD